MPEKTSRIPQRNRVRIIRFHVFLCSFIEFQITKKSVKITHKHKNIEQIVVIIVVTTTCCFNFPPLRGSLLVLDFYRAKKKKIL